MRLFFGLFFFILASTASPIKDDPVDDDGGSGDEKVKLAAPANAENLRDVKSDKDAAHADAMDLRQHAKPDKKDVSVSTLEALLRNPKVLHVKSKDLLSGRMNKRLRTMAHLRSEVLEAQNIITMDLRDTKGTPDEHKVKDYFFAAYAVYFPVELVVVSHKDNNVMFTTFEDIKHPRIPKSEMKKNVEDLFELHSQVNETSRRNVAEDGGTSKLPIIAFNWQHYDSLPTEFCEFGGGSFDIGWRTNYLRYSGKNWHNLCSDRAGIKNIYEVSAFRSLNDDMTGTGTVDKKFLRITSADTSGQNRGAGGGGFLVSDSTGSVFDEFMVGGRKVGRKFSHFFATEYEVKIEALGTLAELSYSMPDNNEPLDVNYEKSSSETIGVSAGIGISKEGPSAELGVSAEQTTSRGLSFNMKDFKLTRTADERSIVYKWERPAIRYPKFDGTPSAPTGGRGDFEKALDFIGPMGYGFVPKFDVMFTAAPTENGRTEFSVDNYVEVSSFMFHYRDEPWPIPNTWWSNSYFDDYGIWGRSIEVDWSHPVFTGFRPVNLQPAVLGTQAFQVEPDGRLILAEVDKTLISQAFIYTSGGTYESAAVRGLCLDSVNITKLQTCHDGYLSQQWKWKKEKATGHAKPGYTDYVETQEEPKRRLGLNSRNANAKITTYLDVKPNDERLGLMRLRTSFMTVFREPDWGQNDPLEED